MIPGIGVGLGFPAQHVSLNQVVAKLVARFGSNITWLGFGDDFALSGSTITSWPGRVGGSLVYSPNSVGTFSRGLTNGRPSSFCAPAESATRALRFAGATAIKSLWAVASADNSFMAGAQNLIVPTTTNQGLVRAYYTLTKWAAGDWTTYRDGTATDDIDAAAVRVYSCDKAASADTNFAVGGYYGDFTDRAPWHMPILFGMALGSVPTEAQRLATAADLKQYFRIV